MATVQASKSAGGGLLAKVTQTTEQKAALLLAAATVLYGFKSAGKVKAKRLQEAEWAERNGKAQRAPTAQEPQDHPVAAWLLTNSSVWAVVALKHKFVGDLKVGDSFGKVWLKMMLGSFVTTDFCVIWHAYVINKLYGHIPFFSDKRRPRSLWEVIKDYAKCNFVANSLINITQAYGFLGKTDANHQEGPWRPLRFLGRLMWFRVGVDIVFWLGHRVLHMKGVYSKNHRTHHEDNATQLTTNYHFDWWDLVIEAFVPFLASAIAYEKAFGPIDQFDVSLIGTYIFWHEIESHAGKPLPSMPLIAPLSTWTQEFDDYNVWFHELHHRILKANYSITPWIDVLLGTIRWEL
ncbi:Fatty acid hydroxylase domain-containing protein 2 [Hondaea fermentalgiana]|uniref:Fatty acid hydroxylase domain-containing protein 2 n=1 Tax=Hondaea fermentalgiana TaxID=2315210 RepID=A0A2R5GBV8_9STRA|nr:Fatty acid hydroxylase domain-containing protein 2 [Hondaea fermentalgiana]|eukprot:GBG28467.1 Fatty acid hydroxylase domain-containing protein 2 [Hondaea fermentalgiana]